MACAIKKEQTIKLEAAQVYWGKEQCRVILVPDDVDSSLNGQNFKIQSISPSGEITKYYVLLTDGTAVDPEYPDHIKIEVTFVPDSTGVVISPLITNALSVVNDLFTETLDGFFAHIKNKWIGAVEDDFSAAPDFEVTISEGIGGFLGRTSEGIEVTIETQSTEITSNQTGEIILDEIGQGQSANCSASFIELSKERLEAMIAGAVGGTHTPSGGTKLIGGGSSKLFQSLKELGGKLILHPQRLPLTDRSEDFVFWKSAPKPESINYSGTDVQALSVTFNAYLDDSKPAEINLFAIGDWSQTSLI
jgi:hypothetical protein